MDHDDIILALPLAVHLQPCADVMDSGTGFFPDLATLVRFTEEDTDNGHIREGYIDIKEEEMLDVLKNIKVDQFRQPDGICPTILK
eukprot:g37204.t1